MRNKLATVRSMLLPLLAIGVVTCVAVASYRFVVNAKLEHAFDGLRGDGYPTTLAELDTFYTRIPDNENGVVVLMRATALQSDTDDRGFDFDPPAIDASEEERKQWEEDQKQWSENLDQEMAETDRFIEKMDREIAALDVLEKNYGGLENAPNEALVAVWGESTDRDDEDDCIDRDIELSTAPLPQALADELNAFFDERRDSLDLIVSASNQPTWRSPIDFNQWPDSVNADHQVAARDACKWLSRRAILAASNADSESAATDLIAALRIASSVSAEPTVMAQLVSFSSTKTAIEALEHVLNRCDLSTEQLTKLDAALAALESPDAIVTALACECALTRNGFKAEKPSEDDFSLFGASNEFWRKNAALRFVYNTVDLGARDNLHFLATIRTMMECCKTVDAEHFRTLIAIGEVAEHPAIYDLNASQGIGSIHMGTMGFYGTLAKSRAARAAIAVQRYRIKNGELPSRLQDVTPEFLSAIPTSPTTGASMQTVRDGAGFAISPKPIPDRPEPTFALNPKAFSATFTIAR